MYFSRFECVSGLEDWLSTVQFNYVGSSPSKTPQVFELTNRTEERDRKAFLAEQQQQQQQQQSSSSSSASLNPPAISLAEQLVEHVVRLLQTGMRGGLRGAFEAVKILDRLPDQIVVPYPDVSFTSSLLQRPSLWFRSDQELEAASSDPAMQGTMAALKGYEIAHVPTKFVKSTLFVVNSAAAAVADGGNTSSISKSAGSQLRMFIRVCLQQRCMLAVIELLLGFLHANDGALADFLYVHPSASPLLHDATQPGLIALLRRFGGPPLIVRAVAQAAGVSIGPLLEAPWDPVACGCTEQPVLATWSMWFAKEGLRLKWNLEYCLPSDAGQPDYVSVDGVPAGLAGGLASGGKAAAADPTPRTDRNGNEQDDDKGSVAGSTTRIVKRIIRVPKKSGRVGTSAAAAAAGGGPTSPGMDPVDDGFAQDESQQQQQQQPQQQPKPVGRVRAATIVSTTIVAKPAVVAVAAAPAAGESPRPNDTTVKREPAKSLPPQSAKTPEKPAVVAVAPAVVAAKPEQATDSNNNNDDDGANDNAATSTDASRPHTNPDIARRERHGKKLAEIEAGRQAAVRGIEQAAEKQAALVDGTIARWERERREFQQTTLADSVQPLLEAYAALVYAKYSAALNRGALAESKMMTCFDPQSGSAATATSDLTPARAWARPSAAAAVALEDEDDRRVAGKRNDPLSW